MPKFKVNVLRDANVTYSAIVEAADLEEVKGYFGKSGYQGPIIGDWMEVDVNTFDDVEHYSVQDDDGTEIYEESRN